MIFGVLRPHTRASPPTDAARRHRDRGSRLVDREASQPGFSPKEPINLIGIMVGKASNNPLMDLSRIVQLRVIAEPQSSALEGAFQSDSADVPV
jgi:hypothetical protein